MKMIWNTTTECRLGKKPLQSDYSSCYGHLTGQI